MDGEREEVSARGPTARTYRAERIVALGPVGAPHEPPMRRYKLEKMKRVHGLHFTPCGTSLLACGGAEARVVDGAILIDLASGDSQARIDQFGTCYAVPPDTSRFVLGGANQWSNELGSIVWAELPGLASWERQRWLKRSLPPRYTGVYGLAFDPTGTRLAVAHTRASGTRRNPHLERAYLTLTDPDTGEPEFNLPAPRMSSVLTFSPDGARLASVGGIEGDRRVVVYDLATRAAVCRYEPPAALTLAARFLLDGRLAVATGRRALVLRADGTEQFALGHAKQVNAVAPTHDGTRLLTAAHDGTVRAWDLRNGNTIAVFDWKIGPITALAFAPDGLTCAAAGASGNVVLWDADG